MRVLIVSSGYTSKSTVKAAKAPAIQMSVLRALLESADIYVCSVRYELMFDRLINNSA